MSSITQNTIKDFHQINTFVAKRYNLPFLPSLNIQCFLELTGKPHPKAIFLYSPLIRTLKVNTRKNNSSKNNSRNPLSFQGFRPYIFLYTFSGHILYEISAYQWQDMIHPKPTDRHHQCHGWNHICNGKLLQACHTKPRCQHDTSAARLEISNHFWST